MKIFKIIAIILLSLIGLVLLINIFTPAVYKVERSIEINADKGQVYSVISKFSRFDAWSPWSQKDTSMKMELGGEDGTVGSTYSWDGNDEVGNGLMAMTELLENEKVQYNMMFGEGKDTAIGYMNLSEAGEGKTKVVWGFTGETPFMFRFFNLFMEGMVAKDFEKGLVNLKTLTEATPTGPEVQSFSVLGGELLYYKEDKVPMGQLEEFFSKGFDAVYSHMQNNGQTPAGPSVGLYYVWDMENGTTDVAAGFPISPIQEGEKLKTEKVNEVDINVYSTHISTVYTGNYGDPTKYHVALETWAKSNEKEIADPAMEIYEVSPQETQDSSAWRTKIIYLLK